jgi:polyhydroxybutyrate depolymerase
MGPRRPLLRTGSAAIVVLLSAVVLASCSNEGGATTSTTVPGTTVPVAVPLVVNGPGRYGGEVASGGLLRRFVLVVPETAPRPAPLVIVFHGFMGSPAEVEEGTGMTRVAEEHGFVVAYPEGYGRPRSWRSDPRRGDLDVVFTRDLVALLDEALGIDGARVYAAGMSNGGGMAARLACDAADLVAAVAGVAGAYFIGDCAPVRPVPVILFHGDADPIVPYEGWGRLLPAIEDWAGEWATRNGCEALRTFEAVTRDVTASRWIGCAADAQVVLYTVVNGHHGWPGSDRTGPWLGSTDSVDASELLWEFFSAHPMP